MDFSTPVFTNFKCPDNITSFDLHEVHVVFARVLQLNMSNILHFIPTMMHLFYKKLKTSV